MALIDRGRKMRSRRTFQRSLIGTLCALGFLIGPPARAADGDFAVANCRADQLNYSTGAFVPDLTMGMRVRSACSPQAGGLKGLTLASVVRRGNIKYRAFAALRMVAPPGTEFKSFAWAGDGYRSDCGFAMQLWAQGPRVGKIKIRNYLPERRCKRRIPGPIGPNATTDITGATVVILRVQCFGLPRGSSCSARRSNYLRLKRVEAVITDPVPPTVAITPVSRLTHGDWVNGLQFIRYEASDNVGIRSAEAQLSGGFIGDDKRACAFAVPEEAFALPTPCPNGPGWIEVDTSSLPQGTQPLVVTATDPAGNVGSSLPVTARIDNAPPGRVKVAVTGGDMWRNANDFAVSWSNPLEPDRAPIVGAHYQLCPVGRRDCTTGEKFSDGLSSLRIQAPAPGEWQVSLWREDAAGNNDEALASDPVTLRYDPEPPRVAFESPSLSDPTLVTVDVVDKVSGLASGTIEMSQTGSGVWQELPTQIVGGRLLARFDDVVLPAGAYILRAHAIDRAHNETTTTLRGDGQPMALSLPVRVVTGVDAAFQMVRTVSQHLRRHGRRVWVRQRVTVMKPSIRARSGEAAQIVGRLTNAAGQGIAGQQLSVFSSSSVSPERAVGVVQTDGDGGYRYTAISNSSQTLRFAFGGSPVMLPAEASVTLTVPALTSFKVDRRRLRNGQTVRFSGILDTLPAPPAGKLLELQVLLPKGWETFRTIRTNRAGRWTARYHFTRTFGIQHYRFRARLPKEEGYPFGAGGSHAVGVEVRGPR